MMSRQDKIFWTKSLLIRTTWHFNIWCNIMGEAFCNSVMFPNGFKPLPPFWTIWKNYFKPILNWLKFLKVFGFCNPSPFPLKDVQAKAEKRFFIIFGIGTPPPSWKMLKLEQKSSKFLQAIQKYASFKPSQAHKWWFNFHFLLTRVSGRGKL